jgi:hypothetical protein
MTIIRNLIEQTNLFKYKRQELSEVKKEMLHYRCKETHRTITIRAVPLAVIARLQFEGKITHHINNMRGIDI